MDDAIDKYKLNVCFIIFDHFDSYRKAENCI